MTGIRRIAPRGLGEPIAWLVVGKRGETGWAPNGIAPRYRDVGDSGKLIGHVAYRWRGKASTTLLGSDHFCSIAMMGACIGEDWDTTCCWVAVSMAGYGCVRQLMLWDEDVRGESGCDTVGRVESSRRGHGVGVGLLRELVEESVPSSQETPIFEHFRARRVELPEVSFPRGAVLPGHLYEAVIEAEVVSDRVLPSGPALAVVGKLLDYVIADLS